LAVLAAGLLLVFGFLGCEVWAYWQEQAARQAMAEEHWAEAQGHIDLALRVRRGWE
jgi:hypothetical protein